MITALAAGLSGISMMQRRALPKSEDLHFEELPPYFGELEAELGRAREELGFCRELHEGATSEKLRHPDSDDS